MKSKVKRKVKIMWIMYLLVGMFLLYAYRYRILDTLNNLFYKDYELVQLSEEQKVEDFEAYYSNIVDSVASLYQVEELYHINFEKRKGYYLEEVRKTKNNFEFFCVMKAISNEVASFHTDVCFPSYSNLRYLKCYGSSNLMTELGMKAKINAWCDMIEESIKSYEKVSFLRIGYIDGKYVVKNVGVGDSFKDLADYELVSIDGVPADKYIVSNISTHELQYDYIHKRPYRYGYTFNDSRGQKVKVVLRNDIGEEQECFLYRDLGAEVCTQVGYFFSEKYQYNNTVEEDVILYRDNVNQIDYIKINSFMNQEGNKLKDYLADSLYDTVVIDLRDNYGGFNNYAQKYLYEELYNINVQFDYAWKFPRTSENETMAKDMTIRWSHLDDKDNDYYYCSDKLNYQGKAKKERKIYYIVGSGTGSAADCYIAMVKKNGLGTIVGTNTGGEGLGASYICKKMKNSSLVYIYYPSMPVDSKQVYNPHGGVAPDIYVEQTREEYQLELQYLLDGNAAEYESRLKYDTVLKWIINNK